ncbi:hypothetical protein EJ08DRAFT_289419 [Tothia fuscella]|uniref:C3H1-type domain-containing protein n=1 Tax=Tothia fuscella TaxID=1048955 RepID=A0A9P4P1W6_9PEZI|nr:hypothetical protein EJ08DRAFT_289419 [Tothia fuscella]
MFVLYQFLVERIKENDYDSAFVKVNLKFLSLCTGLHNEMIKTVGLDKIFTRVAKRGDAEGKALTKKITDNAATESKKIAADSTKKDDAPKIAKPVDNKENVKKDVPLTAGVKRPAPANGVPTPAAKRTVATSSSAPAAGKGGLLKAPPTASASKPSATSLAVAKAKPHQTVTKPATNFFMGLQSASKKPGTSLASSKSVATAGAPEKKAPAKLPAAQPKFSFAETMASLTKAPEPQSTKTEVKLPPETAEQKAKRLRKEERRKLRVTWKPDAALVEIKLFSRDPSEISNNANNVRDVGDGKEKEGLMFKQHVEKDDVDVDDDDDQPMELSFFDYKTPSPINFSDMDEDSLNNNYDPYGGGRKKFESPEKLVQENREASTLMVHYMVKSDIPPCPREPADPYTGEHIETTMFGYPDNPRFLHSLSKFAPQPVVTPDVSAILANLQNFLPHGQVPVQAAPAPPPVPSDPNIALQNLLAGSFGAPQPQMASTPVPPTQEAPLVVDVNSIEAILAKLNGGAPPQAPPPMAQAPPPPPISIPGVDLSQFGTLDQNAMLAAIVNQTQQNNPYAGGVPNGTADHYDIQQYDNQQYDNQQYDQQYSSGERKRGRDDKDGSQGGSGGKKQKWNKQGSGPPKFIFECRFYKKGECRKGADCTYRHDM